MGMLANYDVLLIDPPWPYDDRQGNRPETYNRMSIRQIAALPVAQLLADDAVVYCWATWPTIDAALFVLREWDAAYKTAGFVWVKTTNDGEGVRWGMGHHTRANTEVCLLGVRGSGLRRVDAGVHQIIAEPPGAHSAKPESTRERLGRLYGDVRRLEMFARGEVPAGWDGHGDQCTNAVWTPGLRRAA